MSTFTFEIDLRPRYRDLDPNGHVNNAVYATYFEQVRAEYWRSVVGEPLAEADTALVTLEIEFKAEITLEDQLTVAMRVDPLGDSSIPQVYELRANRDVAATGRAVMVAVAPTAGESRPLPKRWREAIRSYEGANGNDWGETPA